MSVQACRTLLALPACLLLGVLSLPAQGSRIFKGQICLRVDAQSLGSKAASASTAGTQAGCQCSVSRVRRGAHYVLFNSESKTVFQLDGRPKAYVGKNVVVVGMLDKATNTIHVNEIFRALPPVVTHAKSLYIDCDACERGMAAAWMAAFQQVADWKRFNVVPDPKKADIILMLSANPYLGDYITRDGPDKRPVHVDITYMDVIDPRTGRSLWSDSRRWGSLLVSRATKDLIMEFKDQLEMDERAGNA
jgi:hypothetical protein